MFLGTKLATGAVAGVLTLAMTGAAAFAAFQPAEPLVSASVHASLTGNSAAERGKNTGLVRALEAILGRLVENGTITAEQKTEILAAIGPAEAPAAPADGAGAFKRIWGSFMELSVEYLALEKTEVGTALRAGTSLGALADATKGKSRDELILHLVVEASFLIDEAVANGRVTEERAAEARVGLNERVTKFVDHVYEARGAKEPGERAKERVDRFKERMKDLKERLKERREALKAERQDGNDGSQDDGSED